MDRSAGRGRRRTLGPVPQLQVAQDLFYDRAVGDQTMLMGMKAGGIIPVALQRGDHAGEGAAIAGGILEELLDGGVEALAQKAEQLAVVLEAQPQHLGDGDDVLADGEIAQDLFVDVLGKQQGALLMA